MPKRAATMGAYSVLETDEWTGGIVFAKSDIEARKAGANLYNNGEIGGMEVHRRKDLDKYEATGVPAWLLVSEGWWFECFGCGMSINDCTLEDEGLPVTGVVGQESGRIYCCHQCRMTSMADEAARNAFGEAFLEMLRDLVRNRFPGIEHSFGAHKTHFYSPRWSDPIVVIQASVGFNFPGMKFGPATLQYRHEGQWGQNLIGPVSPEFLCCAGDMEAFEAFAANSSN